MLVLWRFVYTKGESVPIVMPSFPKYMIPMAAKLWTKAAHGQGMGRHSEAEAIEIGFKDLRAMSLYLGNPFFVSFIKFECVASSPAFILGTKPYFMGDKPTEVDCALFGMLAMVVWSSPGSFYEQLVNGNSTY